MTKVTHHIPEPLLAAYAAGSLGYPYELVVATHVSLCDECRAIVDAHNLAGGLLVEDSATTELSDGLRQKLMSQLDEPFDPMPANVRSGIYPGPLVEAMKHRPPRWKSLGMGVRQDILHAGKSGSARLLYIPAGSAVPDHGHNGLELTLVLQGSFSDETGRFGVGDVEVADQDLEHTPVADEGVPCICLAATDAPLRFQSLVPRLLQPLFRI